MYRLVVTAANAPGRVFITRHRIAPAVLAFADLERDVLIR